MMFQIAKALEFLEVNRYVHRDVAARNCLGMLEISKHPSRIYDMFSFLVHSWFLSPDQDC